MTTEQLAAHNIESARRPENLDRVGTFSLFAAALVLISGCAGGVAAVEEPVHEPSSNAEAVDGSEPFPSFQREFRGVWIATVSNIDWPSEPGLPTEAQKQELRELLDRAAAMNLNAVVFQVRPAADALYDSPHEPWSEYLTGHMGRAPDPYYDPLAFAVDEAHARGLELHAWFNPYRAHHPSAESPISPDHISRLRPDIVREYGTHLWLDPGEPDAADHTLRVILDVVDRYDIDGVHFDDYFYPYKAYVQDGSAEFPDSAGWARALAEGIEDNREDWRRSNVDRLIERLSREIKERKSHVKFGISPFGIWRPGYPEGTSGFDAYDELYADARKWIRNGWVDYLAPQLYYRMAQHEQPYSVMLQWWTEQNVHGRHVWPGNFTSRVGSRGGRRWPVHEVLGQIYATRAQPGASGNIHFSMRAFMEEPNRFVEELTQYPYAEPALVPASPWLDDDPPNSPRAALSFEAGGAVLAIDPPSDDDVRLWSVRVKLGDDWQKQVVSAAKKRISLDGTPEIVVVSAVDRAGNAGPPLVERGPQSEALRPDVIAHSEWESHPPLGFPAIAARRNIVPGDTARFRDLTVRVKRMTADSASIAFQRGGSRLDTTVAEGSATTWNGYRAAFLAFNAAPDQLGAGLAELELALASSLPPEIASSNEAGGAERRLRIPHEIERVTLHHSGSPEPLHPDDDPAQKLRDLQTWGAAERNWWDVPYHFLIDLEGRIYEGRDVQYMGETNTSYDPRGHLLISVLGNYNRQEATPQQVRAIAALTAWVSAEFGLSPADITGHSEWADTSCPGTSLREALDDGSIVQAAADRLQAAVGKDE